MSAEAAAEHARDDVSLLRQRHPAHGQWVMENHNVIMELLRVQMVALVDAGADLSQGSELALKLWPPGKVAYVTRKLSHDHLKVEVDEVKFDGPPAEAFPGATVLYPMNGRIWYAELSVWMASALLRVLGLAFTLQVLVSIWHQDAPYASIPRLSQVVLYAQIVALVIEGLFVVHRTWKGEGELFDRIVRSSATGHFCANISQGARHLFISFVLRFFNAPHVVLNAPRDSMNTALQLDAVPIPIRYWFSEINRAYERRSGQHHALPKFLLEDLVMFTLKVVLLSISIEIGSFPWSLLGAVLTGIVGFYTAFITVRNYLQVILDSESEYEAHIRNSRTWEDQRNNQSQSESHFRVEGRLKSLPMKRFRDFIKKLPPPLRVFVKGSVLNCRLLSCKNNDPSPQDPSCGLLRS